MEQIEQIEQIEEKVHEFIARELLWNDGGKLDSETQIIEEGVIDSLGLFRLVAFLEEMFRIRVPEEELLAENFETIRTIAQYVKGRMNSEAA